LTVECADDLAKGEGVAAVLARYFGRRPRLLRTPRDNKIAFGNIAALTPTFTGTSMAFAMRRAAANTVRC
jgi:hypothetical protein